MSLQMSSLRSAAPAKAARPHRSTLVVKALFQSRKAAVIEKEREVEKKPVEKKKIREPSGFSGVISALDFAAPRSAKDAEVLYETKANWKKGESKLTPEQYNALARKIRGTYKDYFKDYVVEDRVENTYYKPGSSSGTVPYLPLLVGVVLAMLAATVVVVQQTS